MCTLILYSLSQFLQVTLATSAASEDGESSIPRSGYIIVRPDPLIHGHTSACQRFTEVRSFLRPLLFSVVHYEASILLPVRNCSFTTPAGRELTKWAKELNDFSLALSYERGDTGFNGGMLEILRRQWRDPESDKVSIVVSVNSISTALNLQLGKIAEWENQLKLIRTSLDNTGLLGAGVVID
jgi:hypothetical protein